jgi:MFS family permease
MAETAGTSLWRHPDFLRLWAAQAISLIGSQVSFLALPLVAVVALDATLIQMGILSAVGALPALLLGLHAGVIVDRRRRRPILIAGDVGRAGLLALVPLAWALDALSIEILYAVALFTGLFGLFFDLAYQAFLPTIVPPERLVEGNAKFEMSRTAAEIVGPNLASGLIHFLTAPFAIAVDAASYLVSGLVIARIRTPESAPARPDRTRRMLADIREGLGLVFGDLRLRSLVGARGLLEFFNAMLEAVFLFYVARSLGLGPGMIGLIFTVGNVGFLVGALVPGRISARIGVGPAIAGGMALVGLSDLLVPLASGSRWVIVPLLVTAQFFFGLGMTVFSVNQTSLRQAIVPRALLGRAGAVVRVAHAVVVPLGALLGGIMGEVIGVRETLVLAALGEVAAAVWLWQSPLGSLRNLMAEPVR